MKEYIRIWVILKRVAVKIRSVGSPLRMGRREEAEFWPITRDLKQFWGIWNLGESSEKGCRRKHTGKRVTSWSFMYWGNFRNLRWIAKRIRLGEFEMGFFWGLRRGAHVEGWGGGTTWCVFCVLRESFVSMGWVLWTLLTHCRVIWGIWVWGTVL
jgi:hypothetical protein